jgi:2-phosphoglycolate phosphatase
MLLKNFSTIIFDLDGVLIDSLADLADSVNHMLKMLGRDPLAERRIKDYIGTGNRDLIIKSLGTHDNELVEKGLVLFREHYMKNCVNKTKLRAGVDKLLSYLDEKGIVMAVLSNKFSFFSSEILKKLGADIYFRLIIGPDIISDPKPHPAGIEYILNELGVLKEQALLIGDSESDVICARNAGIKACGVLGGFGDETKLIDSGPDFILDDMQMLYEQFLGL